MILAIPEYDAAPTDPAQWDRYYDLVLDGIYIQTLPVTDPSYPTWVLITRGAAVRESMRIVDTLVKSKYAARDYQTFLDEIVANIAEKWGSEFNNFMSSDPAIMLAEYVAAALDQMSWNLDREADEWYITLARLRDGVAEGARALGYRAAPAVAASIGIMISLPSGPYVFDVTLREGHQFQGPNGLIFTLDSDQTIPAGDTQKLCTVYQGQKLLETFTSTGQPNQVFKFSLVPDGDFVAQGYVKVTVGGVVWPEYDFLPYSSIDSYEVHYLASPPKFKFGDSIIGRVPPSGNEVRVSYIATSGKRGRLATQGTVSLSLTPVVINFQNIPIDCTNPEAASSGDDAEVQESIKANASRWFDTADRCVTKGDIETLAGHFNDPLYGSVAKANALSIRGVSQDLQLKALLDAIVADRVALDGFMEDIRTNQNSIKAQTGSPAVDGSIRKIILEIVTENDAIRALSLAMSAQLSTVQADIDAAKGFIETAQTRLGFLPFQELLGSGDGTSLAFSGTLAMRPVVEGSLAIFVANKTPEKSGTNGDCDAVPGELHATVTPSGFASTDVGKMIRIGGEYRQISKRKSSTVVEYSGARIYGTSLLVDVFPAAVIGYDDGAGNITGTGITGSIAYAGGTWVVSFSTAPAGIAGVHGVPIMTTYMYKGDGTIAVLDDASTACDTAKTDSDVFTDDAAAFAASADAVDTKGVSIGLDCDGIDADADASIVDIDSALYIPDQISNDIDAVYAYLDEVISGECKANIIRISCLVYDSNGFYTAPSASLIAAIKAYLNLRRIETVRYSVVSGAYWLLKVNMTIQLKITDQYVFTEVASRVQATIDTMFKGRAYAQALKRSEYYGIIRGNVGMDYCNANITGSAWYDIANTSAVPVVDSDGNLFIGENEAITKGTISIVQIF